MIGKPIERTEERRLGGAGDGTATVIITAGRAGGWPGPRGQRPR